MRNRSVSLALTVICAVGGLLLLHNPPQTHSQSMAVNHLQGFPPTAANPAYSLYCGLWRVDNGLVSTIHIKNALVVAPLQVTPVLYMSDGREYDLPPVELPTAGTLDVNVNDALAKIPPTIHPSEYGSAELRYEYKNPGHLLASMEIINLHASLIFTYPFEATDEDMTGTHTLEGVWWKHDPAVGGFVALTNLTGGVLQVSAQAIDSAGNLLPAQTFGLLAHSIQMLHLNALTAGLADSENQAGGLRLRYNGEMGALAVSGGLVNERRGYSILVSRPRLVAPPDNHLCERRGDGWHA